MFIFEIGFIFFTFLSVISSKSKKNSLAVVTLILSTITLLLHLFTEGFRWQFAFAYCVFCVLLLLNLRKTPLSNVVKVLSVIGLGLSLLLAIMLPNLIHNKNTGNYAVGSYSFQVEAELTKRSLPTKVWFPIENSQNLQKDYWIKSYSEIGPQLAKLAGMPKFIFQHLTNAKPTYLSNPVKAVNSAKPIVLLSHGRGAIKEFNAFMAQELASHGYVVLAPDHTGGALLSILNDGTKIAFDPKEFGENENLSPDAKQDRVQNLGMRWANDLDEVLNNFQKQFPEYRNRKVIVGGHSTGGGSTMQYCYTRANCLGVIGLDPWFEPVSDEILKLGLSKPLLSVFSDPYEKDFEPINHQRFKNIEKAMQANNVFVKEVVIAKSGHLDYCDAALLSPYSYLFGQDKGKIKTRKVMQIINQHALDFINALAEGNNLQTIQWQTFPEEMNWVDVE